MPETQTEQVLKHPWDDRTAMHRASDRESRVYEALLTALGSFFNEVHGESQQIDYWRTIVGPWLYHYTQVVHERWQCLTSAHHQLPTLTTVGLSHDCMRIPRHTMDFIRGSTVDSFNLQIYSLLGEALGITGRNQFHRWLWPDEAAEGKRNSGLKKRIARHATQIPSLMASALMVDMCVPVVARLRLIRATLAKMQELVLPAVGAGVPFASPGGNHPMRRRLARLADALPANIQVPIAATLPWCLPRIFLEGYAGCRTWADRFLRQARVNTLVTANALIGNEHFKVLAARLRERGGRLVAVQHGGSYGSALDNPDERHEVRVADEFWTWGWHSTQGKTRAMPSHKLSWSRPRRRNVRSISGLCYIGNAVPRYHYRTWSCPTANQGEEYLRWQVRFLRAITPSALRDLCFRLFPQDYGWQIQQRLRKACPELKFAPLGMDYLTQLRRSALVICDMNQTTLLECLAWNIPTIVFWKTEHWEIRPAARSLFEKLRAARILWDTPESAAAAVEKVRGDPAKWWHRSEVQDCRVAFCRRFGQWNDDWVSVWTQSIAEVSRP